MSVTACPKCGSRKIFQGRLKDGVLTGYTDRYVCRDCGYQGSPLIFDSIDEYNKFQMEKKSDKPFDEVSENLILDDNIDLSEKDKEVVDFLNELDDKSTSEIKTKSTILKKIIMLSLVLIFSLIITLFFIPFYFFLPTILVIIVLFIIVYVRFNIKID
ncbi:MAG: hypothetical protein MUO82_05715 [Candidatus Thermoplasmatota archaeon]|nr:hypothetical protein [Candidatus Thermoplasmatota archaeon]